MAERVASAGVRSTACVSCGRGADTRDTEGELGAAHTWMLEISCALLTPSSAAVELKEWSAWAPRWRVC